MSTGQALGLVGSIVGAAIGGPIGGTLGASIGAAIGGTAGSWAGQALDPTVIQVPGLNDKKLQTSQYGVMLGYIWGTFRTAGTVDWIGNGGGLVEHSENSGGKGGGGAGEGERNTRPWAGKRS